MEPDLLRTSGTLTSVLGNSLVTYGYRTHISKTGTPGGTQTHESTDLQSAPLVALVPVHDWRSDWESNPVNDFTRCTD